MRSFIAGFAIALASASFTYWVFPLIDVRFSEKPVPTANPNNFSVIVSNINFDEDGYFRNKVVENLSAFEGVEILHFDKTVGATYSTPSDRMKHGKQEALGYLKESKASVILWGMVYSKQEEEVILYITNRYKTLPIRAKLREMRGTEEGREIQTEQWAQILDVLSLFILTEGAEYDKDRGFRSVDRLEPFISRAERFLKSLGSAKVLHFDTVNDIRYILANAKIVYGQSTRDANSIDEAIKILETLEESWASGDDRHRWANVQLRLGDAISSYGYLTNDPDVIGLSVAKYESAQTVFSQSDEPVLWARVEHNKALSHAQQAEVLRNLEAALLALRLFKSVEETFKLHMSAAQKASLYMNTSNTYALLSEFDSEESRFSHIENVASYSRASVGHLRELGSSLRHVTALFWLGQAEVQLGVLESDADLIRRGITSLEQAKQMLRSIRIRVSQVEVAKGMESQLIKARNLANRAIWNLRIVH